jgi:hypothetical protein
MFLFVVGRCFFLICIVGGGVQMGPLGKSATEWPIVPAPGDYDDGEFSGMKIGRRNQSSRRKHTPAPLCLPQIPLDKTRARTRATAMGSQRLTAWTTARPSEDVKNSEIYGMMTVQQVNSCTSQKRVFTWMERFKERRSSAADDARSLLSSTVTFV